MNPRWFLLASAPSAILLVTVFALALGIIEASVGAGVVILALGLVGWLLGIRVLLEELVGGGLA